jgi:chromosome segregation protein
MRLLRIEASGFKSFCDKTVINFVQNGISVVVGPNGCGKSNIVDAIRWTLGEQSAKQLRGSNMEDVIFNGSSGRQAVSVAQVTLAFSNPEGDTIPKYSEFSEIAITRRLYRNGESQYLINKTACRLTDIRELFMDTGIGGKGYSIIEQGKVDQIITSRAEDRRMIIDEAAGIVKFKTKRIEAERKFAATKQNLLRVEDVLAELIRQEETLVVQVEKAEEYLTAKARLERLQNCIAATRWYRLKEQADRIGQNRDKAIEQKNDLELMIANLETREATLSLEISGGETELGEFKGVIQALKEKVIKLESRLDTDRITLENLDQWEKKNREESELIDKQIKTVGLQLTTYQTEQKKLQQEITGKTEMMEKLREVTTTSDADLSSQKIRLHHLQQKEVESMTAVVAEQNQREQLTERLKEVVEKEVTIEQKAANLQTELHALVSAWDTLSGQIDQKKARKRRCTESIKLYSNQKEDSEQALNILKSSITKIGQEINQAESKLESLQELVLSHEEYDTATKKVLDALTGQAETARKLGYLGTLAEMVTLPDELSHQTTAFLNRYYNLLIFKSVEKLKEIVELTNKSGLEQFQLAFLDTLVADSTKPQTSLARLLPTKGEKADSFAFVESFTVVNQPLYELPKERLLAADSLIDSGANILTRERIFLVGQPGKSNLAETFVKRRKEIKGIESGLSALKQSLATAEAEHDQKSEMLDELNRTLKSTQQELVSLDLELVGLEKEYDGKALEKQRFENMKKSIEGERSQALQLKKDFESKIKKLSLSIEDNQQKQETIRKVCAELKHQIDRTETSREAATNELQQIKVVLAALQEKQQHQTQGIERMTKDLAERTSQQAEILKRVGETDDKRNTTRTSLQKAEAELPKLLEEVRGKEQIQHAMTDALELKRVDYLEIKEQIKKESQNIAGLKEKNYKLEIKLAQLAQEAKNIEDNLFAEDALKPEDLIQTFDVKTFDIEQETETIAQLKRKVGSMTDINLAAKGEYDTLKERLDFLQTQSADLTQSMAALESSINKINQESRKRFRTTFERVNEEFGKLFPQLFGGGEAYLRLTDESDLLEAGVEIIAQPPGKKLQNMTLLSGGEKALTAIALIFAVFMIKPSPFCLLDEVDAPLDDANNVRFNKHVQAMTANSQFIIITHNKKTMEIGDALFGITMEEPGISKVVSVDFNTFRPEAIQKTGQHMVQ